MVVVAVVGLVMGGGVGVYRLKQRRDRFLSRAQLHEEMAVGAKLEDRSRKDLARLPRQTEYHVAMARKYRHAARYPWLPVEPDPQMPEP
jgi:hypothetical protein